MDERTSPINGKPKYTNKLIDSASPYLLQHAHNPINWYPWGEEALDLAKKEDKPIFVSIGYSTCYWCHVMEREVFSDEEVAQVLNKFFINIKVDREERPDLDEIYMSARQIITGQGGWPNNIFLTPELKPFCAGGTFAKDNRYGGIGFAEISLKLASAWHTSKQEVNKGASQVSKFLQERLGKRNRTYANSVSLDSNIVDKLSMLLSKYFDKNNGGFFNSPKFPSEAYLLFLLHSNNKINQEMALFTLEKIACGGIHDHLAGGFHRYTVDSEWKVPHFEKMLYTQSLLADCYLEAYQISKNTFFKKIAISILHFVQKEMQSPEGGFYSAIDAETSRVEGAYYVWNEQDIAHALTDKQCEKFFTLFGLADIPKVPGHLHPIGGALYVKDSDEYKKNFIACKKLVSPLLFARHKRNHPRIDKKIIVSWHAMMVRSFAKAGIMLEDQSYIDVAIKSGMFLYNHFLSNNNRLNRIIDSKSSISAFAEDYAATVSSCLYLYEATSNQLWLDFAKELILITNQLFKDHENGGYFTSEDGNDVPMLVKESNDNAIPSANAMMVNNMVKMALLTGDKEWLNDADYIISNFTSDIKAKPISYTFMIDGITSRNLAEKQLSHVKLIHLESPSNVKAGEIFSVTIELEVEKGYYIYANQSNQHQMTIEFNGSSNLEIKEITYPQAKLNKTIKDYIYNDKVVIKADLKFLGKMNDQSIEDVIVSLKWQACSRNICYKPTSMRIEFSVQLL